MTAMLAVLSAASGSTPSFSSSTMPCRAVSSAISWWRAASTAGADSQASMPTA